MTTKKAAPSKEYTDLAPDQYEVLQVSYINGALQPIGAIVRLPDGVEAGSNLKKVGSKAES